MKQFSQKQLWSIAYFGIIYFSFYLCRNNMSVAKIGLGESLKLDKTSLGLILSFFTFAYAVGQVFHGYLADKLSGRKILFYGLAGSALANLFIPFGGYWLIAFLWLVNGYFQSTGWSVCSKSVGRTLVKENRAFGLGIWGLGYQLGGATAIILAGYFLSSYGWQSGFTAHALLLSVPLVMLLFFWREDEDTADAYGAMAKSPTSSRGWFSREILFLMLTYMVLGFIRYSFINWGIEYQTESLGTTLPKSIINLALLPLGGAAGVLVSGYLSDRFLRSQRISLSFAMMLCISWLLALFLLGTFHAQITVMFLLSVIGALIAACDCFIGTTTTFEYASQHDEGKAIGLVDAFMYVGAIGAGYLNGYIIDHFGWMVTKWLWIIVALSGALVLIPLFNTEKKHADNSARQARDEILAEEN